MGWRASSWISGPIPADPSRRPIQVADLFVESGIIVIVTVKGRDEPARAWFATKEGTFSGFPMAALVNKLSVGASEIVAACLQDHERAIIVGERTYGKGIAQAIVPLEGSGSALKLPSAAFFRPSGKGLHRFVNATESDEWGVSPDPGCEASVWSEELERYRKYRQERDIFADQAPPSSVYKDGPLEKALSLLAAAKR